jgi:hypothetical protein
VKGPVAGASLQGPDEETLLRRPCFPHLSISSVPFVQGESGPSLDRLIESWIGGPEIQSCCRRRWVGSVGASLISGPTTHCVRNPRDANAAIGVTLALITVTALQATLSAPRLDGFSNRSMSRRSADVDTPVDTFCNEALGKLRGPHIPRAPMSRWCPEVSVVAGSRACLL